MGSFECGFFLGICILIVWGGRVRVGELCLFGRCTIDHWDRVRVSGDDTK